MPGRTHLALAVTLALGGAVVGSSAAEAAPGHIARPLDATLRDAAGKRVGVLRIEDEGPQSTRITVSVWGLPAGFHGFHVHSAGTCDARAVDPATGSPFTTAGGHLDLDTSGHHGGHSGDLPALLVGQNGTGRASFVTDRFRVAQLSDADGSAVVVHALPDNYGNIPTRYTHPADATGTTGADATTLKAGDTGNRIACGVLR
ncbi:superoxide dismutase family protein [Microtetraspora sp. NBRC 16547]|uniref:superoxide dismutase family protein n=1 Tax=Microtetraspora sp. NBRC 16547 TaxID=3030993 RepID=UPI0024A34629|nr:superoxide dismutase family protein [Microtetraspora sp. NBRC 16547]GLX00210.1 superoxide dismutase [Cu-Zn] [Microtetraspora sp. NBRC 16547]